MHDLIEFLKSKGVKEFTKEEIKKAIMNDSTVSPQKKVEYITILDNCAFVEEGINNLKKLLNL